MRVLIWRRWSCVTIVAALLYAVVGVPVVGAQNGRPPAINTAMNCSSCHRQEQAAKLASISACGALAPGHS